MNIPDLKKAYGLLLALGGEISNNKMEVAFVVDEAKGANDSLIEQFEEFNNLLQESIAQFDNSDIDATYDALIRLRVQAINISTDFDNFREQLDLLIRSKKDN